MASAKDSRQLPLFPAEIERLFRQIPEVGQQADIRYFGTRARSALNGPQATGMPFWSINPYVGCAFGCAYCYARYAHRYAMERHATDDRMDDGLREDAASMPFWLAFERRIFVKQNTPEK